MIRNIRIKSLIVYFLIFSAVFPCAIEAVSEETAVEENDLAYYINEISRIMTDTDILIRNIGLNILPVNEGVKRLGTAIARIELLRCPEVLAKDHKMILLSFKKMRAGLLLLSPEKKDPAVKLIKNGTRLLRHAATDIVAVAKKEGIIKEKQKGEGKKEKIK
jgi:hypothetical protein